MTPLTTLNSPNTVASVTMARSGRRLSTTPNAIETRPPRAYMARSPMPWARKNARATPIAPVTRAHAPITALSTMGVMSGHSRAITPAQAEIGLTSRYPSGWPPAWLLKARWASANADVKA